MNQFRRQPGRLIARLAIAVTAVVLAVVADAAQGPAFSVTTVSPKNHDVVADRILWRVKAGPDRVRRVVFTIDGGGRWIDRRAPFQRYVNADALTRGRHTLRATATAKTARKASSSISIIVEKPQVYWGAFIDGNDTYGRGFRDAPWDSNTWDAFESHAGKQVSIVHWGMSLPPWRRDFDYHLTPQRKVLSRGSLGLVSMSSGEVSLRDIAAGRYDSSLRRWSQQAAAWGHPFFLRWNWEMNGDWFPWGSTQRASDYVAAWRRFHDIATEVGATNVTWVWCPNTEFPGSTPLGELYPGDTYVDWTCVDVYNKGGSRWQSFSDLFAPTYRQLLQIAPSRPMMIAETGSVEEGGSKAEWITSLLTRDLPLRFPRVEAVVWFNWRIHEDGASWPWPIESSASAEAAFAAGISAPYYAAPGAFQIPARGFKILPLED